MEVKKDQVTDNRARTARFASVVDACGRPEIVYLWTQPEEDPQFMKATRENRVMTLTQENVGTRKDFGVVGMFEDQDAAYLVFPRPLNEFRDRRVIGIDYGKIKTPGPVGKVVKAADEASGVRSRHEPNTAESGARDHVPGFEARATKLGTRFRRAEVDDSKRLGTKSFRVTFTFIARAEAVQEVEAGSRKEAIEKAQRSVRTPDFSKSTISKKVVRVELS